MCESGAASPGLALGDDPAHGVFRFAGCRGVELLKRFWFDKFSFGRREVGNGEFGPVLDGAMYDAGGSMATGLSAAGPGSTGEPSVLWPRG
jgi:hypothetical protein